jgi:hypothetical protein
VRLDVWIWSVLVLIDLVILGYGGIRLIQGGGW